MGDVISRIGFDAGGELGPLLGRRLRADQHAVSTRSIGGLHHEFIEVFQHIAQVCLFGANIGGHIGQDDVFTEVILHEARHVGVNDLVVGDAGAGRVGEGDVACLINVHQSRNTQHRI